MSETSYITLPGLSRWRVRVQTMDWGWELSAQHYRPEENAWWSLMGYFYAHGSHDVDPLPHINKAQEFLQTRLDIEQRVARARKEREYSQSNPPTRETDNVKDKD